MSKLNSSQFTGEEEHEEAEPKKRYRSDPSSSVMQTAMLNPSVNPLLLYGAMGDAAPISKETMMVNAVAGMIR